MKITIFGLAGTGTSSVAKLLCEKLNYSFNSTGNIFREKAKEHKMSIYDFDEYVKNNLDFDRELDLEVKKFGKSNDNFVFESRLAWNFIPDSIKIKLNCDIETTFERIADREKIPFDEAKEKTLKRAKTLEERYALVYPNLSYPPKNEIFDIVIDNTNMSVEEEVEKIIEYLNQKET